MRYPNLRYGNPNEMQYYCIGKPLKHVAKQLRRSERSVHDWLTGRKKVPWWIPELMRLQKMECDLRLYQMNMRPVMQKLGIVSPEADVLQFTATKREHSRPNEKPRLVDGVTTAANRKSG